MDTAVPTFRLCFSTPRLICTIISRGAIGGLKSHAPPSTTTVSPVTNVPALLASHTHVSAMSDFSPMRRIGTVLAMTSSMPSAPGASLVMPAVSRIGPGAIPATRMP